MGALSTRGRGAGMMGSELNSEEIQAISFESTGSGTDDSHEAFETPGASGQIAPSESPAGELLASESASGSYTALIDLVERIRSGRTDGMAELYQLFSKGIRFYL